MIAKESNTSYNTKENMYNKEAYTDGSKKSRLCSIICRHCQKRGLPEEATIYTAEMIAIKIAMREM